MIENIWIHLLVKCIYLVTIEKSVLGVLNIHVCLFTIYCVKHFSFIQIIQIIIILYIAELMNILVK